jgi:RNA polymerase sigma-32 factor
VPARRPFILPARYTPHDKSLSEHSLHENQPLLTSCRNAEQITAAFPGYGLPISELISEGNVGLMQAIKRFEPEKGFRLSKRGTIVKSGISRDAQWALVEGEGL